jgi:hypothetical protein
LRLCNLVHRLAYTQKACLKGKQAFLCVIDSLIVLKGIQKFYIETALEPLFRVRSAEFHIDPHSYFIL